MISENELRSLLPAVCEIADQAAGLVMAFYNGSFAERRKADNSPVTEADDEAETLILGELAKLSPVLPAVAEEAASRGQTPVFPRGPFWLVDPLDGTREFLDRNGEFTVNIALVDNHRPVLGVVVAPARDASYRATISQGAEKRSVQGNWQSIRARPVPESGAVVISSRSHSDRRELQRLIRNQIIARHETAGSSLKFCLLAEGKADFYPRYGPTSEWDTAAGHAILAASGGTVRRLDGQELAYGKPGWLNPEFIARGIV